MTLSQTAILTKQVITISSIALVLGIISFIGYKIWYSYYLASLPPVEEKPDPKFGILPSPEFSKTGVSSSNFSYAIDTVTGGLPKVGIDSGFEKFVKVYFVTKTVASLLSPERSQNLAERFGFKSPPQILSQTKHQFTLEDKILNVDLDTGNFIYQKNSTPSATGSLDDETKLASDFHQVLSFLGVLKPDLTPGRSKSIPIGGGIGQISLWPNPLYDKPIVTAEYNTSLINGQVNHSADNIENYLKLNFTYYPVDISTFATYPIKTTDQALEDLKFGKGSVVIEPSAPQVSITSMHLAYFLGEHYSPYLLPVFVFEGPQFAAYVSAITEQYQSQTP